MATPIYKGAGQPATAGGWLSGLASWFSGPAPTYAGKGQTAQASTGYLGSTTPAYKPAPASTGGTTPTPSADADLGQEAEQITVLIPVSRELFERQT